MRSARCIATLVSLLLATACGGGDGPTGPPPPPGGSANFTASVNGQAWASAANLTNVTAVPSGTYLISRSVLAGTSARAITLTLMNIPGPGTYPLGTGAGVSGGTAINAESAGGWGTPLKMARPG